MDSARNTVADVINKIKSSQSFQNMHQGQLNRNKENDGSFFEEEVENSQDSPGGSFLKSSNKSDFIDDQYLENLRNKYTSASNSQTFDKKKVALSEEKSPTSLHKYLQEDTAPVPKTGTFIVPQEQLSSIPKFDHTPSSSEVGPEETKYQNVVSA